MSKHGVGVVGARVVFGGNVTRLSPNAGVTNAEKNPPIKFGKKIGENYADFRDF